MRGRTRSWLRRSPNVGLVLITAVACNEEVIGSTPQEKPWLILPIAVPTVTVTHVPTDPTTNDTVTFFATSSDPEIIAATSILLDDRVVASCAGADCAYSAALAAGPHTYRATATDTSGNSLNDGPHGFTVWLEPATSARSPTSPHWPHMRTSVIDYRIHYQKEPQRTAEYNWAAARYDHVVSGRALLSEYRRRNPTIRHSIYDRFWFTPVSEAGTMENWLRANGFPVESAYLHAAGTTADSANRITAKQFAGRDFWYLNLADPGFRAWRVDRTRQLMAPNLEGHASGTLFFDTNANSTVRRYIPAQTLEYASYDAYFADFHALLAEQRSLVPAGYVMLNQAQHFTKADEMVSAGVAGGVMTEYGNTPYGNTRWDEVDQLLAAGVVVQLATGVSPGSKNTGRGDMTPGNYDAIAQRVLMWEYCSYLMVVDPQRMDAVLFETYGLNWSHPFSVTWLRAFERDIGLARAPRSVLHSGTDGAGQRYRVYSREFENDALVLIRPQGGTRYGGQTAVPVTLPPGEWRMLRADGSVTGVLTNLELRNSEAVILVR